MNLLSAWCDLHCSLYSEGRGSEVVGGFLRGRYDNLIAVPCASGQSEGLLCRTGVRHAHIRKHTQAVTVCDTACPIILVVLSFSANPVYHELLLTVLWYGVVHTSALVRCTAARMFEVQHPNHKCLLLYFIQIEMHYNIPLPTPFLPFLYH